MEKLHRSTSKTFLKIAGGRMHTPHPTSQVTSYRNHEKRLARSVKGRHSQKGRGASHNAPLNTLLSLRLGL